MTDKELRRLNRRELLQMLIVQCEEAERLQEEATAAKARLKELEEGYERLKMKLNVKDERLNQKDAKIMELNSIIEEMQMAKVIEWRESGAVVDAALLLEGIFKMAQRTMGNTGTIGSAGAAGNIETMGAAGNIETMGAAGNIETMGVAGNIETAQVAGTIGIVETAENMEAAENIEQYGGADESTIFLASGDGHG